MIKLIGPVWVDENNNGWSKNRYTKEQAERMSKTLINCTGCLDCKDCINCTDCINCKGCRNCKDCINCTDCIECKDVEGYFDCQQLF